MRILNNPVCQLVAGISGSLWESFHFGTTTTHLLSRMCLQIKYTAVLQHSQIITGLFVRVSALCVIQDITGEIAVVLGFLQRRDTTDRLMRAEPSMRPPWFVMILPLCPNVNVLGHTPGGLIQPHDTCLRTIACWSPPLDSVIKALPACLGDITRIN